ncbi:MAG: 50S ribosomal protein L28 [bacterium]
MAKCAVCGKTQAKGYNVSHSHVRTKRTWKPNLQKVKTLWEGKVQRINVCTKCLKAGKVQRVI